MKRGLIFAAALFLAGSASADCACRCVGGEVRALCTSTMEIPPICSPQICPIVPPSIAPIPTPSLSPLGTQSCRQVQVLNPMNGQYQWRTVCQ